MRYSRQELVIGPDNQKKVQLSKVAIIGVGALGTVSSQLLTRAGVGEILLIDRDTIEESNLQRQLLFDETDIGKSKAEVAKVKLQKINSAIKITSKTIHVNNKNISLLSTYDLILDCTDNLSTRFLLDDYCRKYNKPWIYAAAIKTQGYVMPILPNGPCLQDFIEDASGLDTCDTVGVLNTITTLIGSLQTDLALKIMTNQNIECVLYHINLKNASIEKIKVKKQKEDGFKYLEQPEKRTLKFCNKGRYQVLGKPINLSDIKKRLEKIGHVQDDGIVLHFKKITLFKDGRALIKADSKKQALAIYSKYIGN